ncbi:ABC transporter ATP-binding protein [Palleronia abyssalis]|uniref:High-affinity branched-chain amino acid transport ATP-binding protein LivF n=1 Tax=Palleronia abyssalis TaxID=1501240 RepID=A0A2R8BZ20_9RHOB|nr:ABC transporter ATP-binding protein [Palleronia abyssalis]SPJ25417.1 High-affinity branched-chain amino acid transport ATP-binding protein LivF [Palleronia abyssalis]
MTDLTVENLSVVYGQAIAALDDVTMTVSEGRMTALMGANGAGKSTVLKAISGVLEFERGRISTGRVTFGGQQLNDIPVHRRSRMGVAHVREGRHILSNMTVEENLDVAGFAAPPRSKAETARIADRIYGYFPVLGERRRGTAGYLSGGEQQMLAIGRAIAAEPRVMLVDEASLGLAPMIAEQIFEILGRINADTGLTILIVEQNVGLALRYAEYVYVLENGRVALEGTRDTIGTREEISARYLGGDTTLTEMA